MFHYLQDSLNENNTLDTKKKNTLKILSKLSIKSKTKEDSNDVQQIAKKRKKNEDIQEESTIKQVRFEDSEEASAEEEEVDLEQKDEKENEVISDTKRAITYQIAKNKGLTPHRKKEQRNPRVKHRNKFRKAKIRRKGAVSTTFSQITFQYCFVYKT